MGAEELTLSALFTHVLLIDLLLRSAAND